MMASRSATMCLWVQCWKVCAWESGRLHRMHLPVSSCSEHERVLSFRRLRPCQYLSYISLHRGGILEMGALPVLNTLPV